MGKMFFAIPEGARASFPVGETQPTSIMTISGAETGKLTLAIENIGEVLHEIRSPLFMATKEVKADIKNSGGEVVAILSIQASNPSGAVVVCLPSWVIPLHCESQATPKSPGVCGQPGIPDATDSG